MSHAAIVLGGTGGIGRQLVEKFRQRGLKVGVLARKVPAEGDFDAFESVDALDAAALHAAIERLLQELPPVKYAAHCVGSIVIKPMSALSLEEFKSVLDLNVGTAFSFLKALTPKLMPDSSVAFCSSVAATLGLGHHEAIAAAKAGLEGLVRSAAASLVARQIRVNAVAPTLTRTPLAARITANEAALKSTLSMIPLGRIAEPEDIAAALSFLCSEHSKMLTGQILHLDGGMGEILTWKTS